MLIIIYLLFISVLRQKRNNSSSSFLSPFLTDNNPPHEILELVNSPASSIELRPSNLLLFFEALIEHFQ